MSNLNFNSQNKFEIFILNYSDSKFNIKLNTDACTYCVDFHSDFHHGERRHSCAPVRGVSLVSMMPMVN